MQVVYRPKWRHNRDQEWRYYGPASDGKGYEFNTYGEAETFISQEQDWYITTTERGIDKIYIKS